MLGTKLAIQVPEPPIFTPEDFHSYLAARRKVPVESLAVPPRLLATFDSRTFDSTRRLIRGHYLKWYYGRRLAVGTVKGVPIAVLHSFIGSSAAAMMLEEMIASGVRSVIEVGVCGSIAPRAHVGDIIVADEAFVDEGTSGHYFRNQRRFSASPELTKRLERVLKRLAARYAVGGVWTTDAPYRETRSKLLKFRRWGALGVNMESSALFAVAKYRGIDIASVQVVSDIVGEDDWAPRFHERRVARNLFLSSRAATEALLAA